MIAKRAKKVTTQRKKDNEITHSLNSTNSVHTPLVQTCTEPVQSVWSCPLHVISETATSLRDLFLFYEYSPNNKTQAEAVDPGSLHRSRLRVDTP